MRPYSTDLRLRVVQAYENREGSMRQLAARFRLSLSWVRDLLTCYRLTGDVTPKPHGGGSPAKLDATGLALVRTALEQQPDATLQELGNSLRATVQVTVSPATMSRGLAKLGLSRKKNLSRRRASTPRYPAATHGLPRHPPIAGPRRPGLSR